jgi:hypothetical protein
MNPSDRADAAARALDLLPPDDPARGDPRMARDPGLVAEARATREATADLWLAVSPLRAAPPEVLHAVLEKVKGSEPAAPVRSPRLGRWLAASGWAAAALVAFVLWPKRGTAPESTTSVVDATPRGNTFRDGDAPATAAGTRAGRTRRHQDLVALRESVERLREDRDADAPRVMSLIAPGAARRTPEETRERVRAALASALRSSLELESGAPSDPAALVIERGWLPDGVEFPADGTLLRHRNFPEGSWRELGLRKSEAGDYYDPAREILWSRDPTGGGFLGIRNPDANLADFQEAEESEDEPNPGLRLEPEGFVIEDPVNRKAEVLIDNVPAPDEGNEQVVKWTDASGQVGTVSLTTLAGALGDSGGLESGQDTQNLSGGGWAVSASSVSPVWGEFKTVSLGLLGVGNLSSFQLVERPIVPNGTPERVIVDGGE